MSARLGRSAPTSNQAATSDRLWTMRLLVTGGAGFIGANFVHNAVSEFPDDSVTVLDAFTYASNAQSLKLVADKIRIVEGDVADAGLVSALVAESDAVVHFAAETHNDNALENPAPFLHSNVIGTFTLLEAVRQHGVRLHHISTDEVYGDLQLNDPDRFTDHTPYNPSSPYSATKAAADMLVRGWARSYKAPVTISNCPNNYGPYQHVEKFIPRQITNVLSGRRPKLYGSGTHVRDWIHVDDHNSAVRRILADGQIGRTYLIGAENERNNLSVLQTILKMLGRDPDDFDHVADRPGHDLRYAIDPTVTYAELDWKPEHTDFESGLSATIEWYRQNESWWAPLKEATELHYAQIGH